MAYTRVKLIKKVSLEGARSRYFSANVKLTFEITKFN